ncbi:MAG: hypothetical protein DI535_24750 [Citrobacter freundii]|nr:MAG: hypothetical protein DI535_24750 [Citrobacter freundii]
MKPSRLRTLLIGVTLGVVYAYLVMKLVNYTHTNVSIAYIFVLPMVMGAIPVLFSTKEQLRAYALYLAIPWISVILFFSLALIDGSEGTICLMIIIAPFLLLGTLAAFVAKLIKLNREGPKTKLYASLLLPFLVLVIESNFKATDQFHSVKTSIEVNADKQTVWENIKNVKDIQSSEIETHFIHVIGIPKPLNGELDKEGIGGTRKITWEKGIRFEEKIKSWDEGNGFAYDIDVDPGSIPPTTLDEHVMIGGKYFDVVEGSYHIDSIAQNKTRITLSCTYRITTNLNAYSKWWADFILEDFNEMILEVIRKRSEAKRGFIGLLGSGGFSVR